MINRAFIDELKGNTAVLEPQSPKDYLFPSSTKAQGTEAQRHKRTSRINLEFLESLKAGEHKEVQENHVIPSGVEGKAAIRGQRTDDRGQRTPIEIPAELRSPYMAAPTDPSEPTGFARKGIEPKRVSFKQDISKAVKETPENIWIGTIGMGASTLEAIKRRAMQLSGGGILPDEAVRQQFEAVEPQPKVSLKQPLPGAVTSEAFGLVTRLPDIGAKILRAKQQKLQQEQDKATMATAPITRLTRSVMQSGVPSMGVAVGLSVLTGSPAVGLAVLGETEGGAAFEEQLQAGASIRKANIIGNLSEAAEIGGEMLVLPKIVKGFTKGIPLQQALNLIAENATQEGVTGFNQKFLEVFGKETSKGTPIKDAVKYAFAEGVLAIPENAFVGGATAGLADVAAAGTSRLVGEKPAKPKKFVFEGDVQPILNELRKEAEATRKQRAEEKALKAEKFEAEVGEMEKELGEIQRGTMVEAGKTVISETEAKNKVKKLITGWFMQPDVVDAEEAVEYSHFVEKGILTEEQNEKLLDYVSSIRSIEDSYTIRDMKAYNPASYKKYTEQADILAQKGIDYVFGTEAAAKRGLPQYIEEPEKGKPLVLKPALEKPKTPIEKAMVEQMTEMGKAAPAEKPTWKRGAERPFAFDENSTVNEGRFRLADPAEFHRQWTSKPGGKNPPSQYNLPEVKGIQYIVGYRTGQKGIQVQAIRFKKNIFTEEKARDWWEANRDKFKFAEISKTTATMPESVAQPSVAASKEAEPTQHIPPGEIEAPGKPIKGRLDIAKIQEAIESGGEKAILSAQKSAMRANMTYYVQKVNDKWRISAREPAKGDYYSILPTGEVFFGKTATTRAQGIRAQGIRQKGTKLTSGWDPGMDQFIAEDIKPAITKAKEAASYIKEIAKAVPRMFMSVLEPAKAAEKRAGREAYTATIKAIHRPEVKALEFEETRLKRMDSNIEELRKWFDKFSKEQKRNFLIANAGQPGSIEAEIIQKDALSKLPAELKDSKVVNTIREISENNFRYLKEVVGNNIGWVQDYFYGIYKNPDQVNKFIKYWKTTKRFTKQKILPSLADAINYGVEPRYDNYIDNLKAEYMGIARLEAMKWLKDDLMRTGKGVYIDDMMEAPKDWQSVKDPVFNDVSVKPELAELINNLISTNKISQNPVLNAIRKVNNFLRIVKFTGSIFHLRVIAKQAVADSGYLGFLRGKKTATRGFTLATEKKWKEIQSSPEYRKLLELGFGHRYSMEEVAQQQFKNFVNKINSGNFIGATLRAVKIPLTINLKFADWMFNQYIPMVKTMKVMDDIAELEKKTGRQASDWEIINIIKETQNFYGEMNERLFGRSGTATSVLRFFFLAPGFAEGNYRTILKSLTQWGQYGGWRAGLSRANIVNSALLTGILSTIGTLILTGKPPEEPKTLEDIRDLFKIDTGRKDSRGRKVMIDLMDYDKDYWNIYFNVLRGRPDTAVYQSLRRLGGMKAPLFEVMLDFMMMATGKAIYDWKGDRVTEITDSWLEKLMKIAVHEAKKTEPIPMSIYHQLRKKDTEKIISFVETVSGYRPTTSEKDKRESEILRRCWSLKGQQEEMYQSLATIDKPREAVKWYNDKVADVLDSKLVPQIMKDEWLPKLTIDLERFLQNKAHTASLIATTKDKQEETERAIKVLKNFKITTQEAEQLLADYYNREKKKPAAVSPLESDRVIGRALKRKRLEERMK